MKDACGVRDSGRSEVPDVEEAPKRNVLRPNPSKEWKLSADVLRRP